MAQYFSELKQQLYPGNSDGWDSIWLQRTIDGHPFEFSKVCPQEKHTARKISHRCNRFDAATEKFAPLQSI